MILPEPSEQARAASDALTLHIRREITAHGGWMSFARFMELLLYTPQLGYYSGGAKKLGEQGDFTTAPEMTPLFGATLAQVAAHLMAQSTPQLLEFGAGTGQLAHDVLTELAAMNVSVTRYAIVELSGELRARQQEKLRDFPQVCWLDALPPSFSGVVLANEVLDAMPVHLVCKQSDDAWCEQGVAWSENQGFVFEQRACSPELLQQIGQQILDAEDLPVGYLTEVHPLACGFIHTLAAMLQAGRAQGVQGVDGAGGAAILIDYGFPAHEYYLAQRSQGTLMCHYRHYAHADPFYLPGLQDVTAHVDFSAMARTAIMGGLDVLGYMGQAAFLIHAGIGDLLLRTPVTEALRYLPQAKAVQKLVSPAEMGELFKVLVLGVDVNLPPELARGDHSYKL